MGRRAGAPVIEVEAFLRLFLGDQAGDQASVDDLQARLTSTPRHVRAEHTQAMPVEAPAP